MKKSITIVTICRNNPNELKRTLDSYNKYLNQFIDAVIIDGSDNNSCKNIADFYGVTHSYQMSKGIYAAMNEGVTLSTGSSIIFMNAGDAFHSDFNLVNFEFTYRNILSEKIIFGNSILYYRDFYKCNIWNQQQTVGSEWLPSHQSIFTPSTFLKKTKFDVLKKVSSDSEVLMLAFKTLPYVHVADFICKFELGGISSRPTNLKNTLLHCCEIITTRKMVNPFSISILFAKQIFKMYLIKVIGYERYLRITN